MSIWILVISLYGGPLAPNRLEAGGQFATYQQCAQEGRRRAEAEPRRVLTSVCVEVRTAP